jgi:hypothetical protein
MIRQTVAAAAMFAVVAVPGTAMAEGPGATPLCAPLPNTVGLEVKVGDKTVHVPAISNARLCVQVDPVVGGPAPVSLTVYQFCGTPCFRLVVEDSDWTVASTRVSAYLSYETDSFPHYVQLVDVPISVRLDNPTPVCVAVGNPIPDCPENSIAVPVPTP